MFAKRFPFTKTLSPMALVLLAALLAATLWSPSAAAQDAPAEPADLTVQSGNGRLDLNWTAPSGKVTGYEVQYKYTTAPDQQTSNFQNGWQSRTHAGTGTTHAITGLTNGDYKAGTLRYDVRVRAVDGAARSAWVQGTGAPGDAATRLMLMGNTERELRDGNLRGRLRGQGWHPASFVEYVYEAQGTFPVTAQLDGIAPAGGYTVTLSASGAGADALTMPEPFQVPAGQDRAVADVVVADDEVSELTKWFTLSATVSPAVPVRNVDGYAGGAFLFAVVDNDQANWSPSFDLDGLTVNGAQASGPTYDGHNRVVRYSATVANNVNAVSVVPEFGTSCPGCLYWSGPADGVLFDDWPKGNRNGTRFQLSGNAKTVWVLVTDGKGRHHHARITVSKLSGSDPSDYGQGSATYAIHPDQLKTGPNHDPEIMRALPDIRIANQHRTRQIDLFGVFDDPDYDGLAIAAASSNENIATVSVVPDYSTMTVSSRSPGTATITVTAADIRGGRVSDTFVVRVKSPPKALSSLADIAGLPAGGARNVSLSGVFGDADGDPLTVTASSSAEDVATVSVASDQSGLTVKGVGKGETSIHVVALDTDGNPALNTFEVRVDQGAGQQPSVTPEPESAVSRYDANDDGIIDKNEYAQALRDYEARIINYNDLSAVKAAFLAPRVVAPLPHVTIVNENGARDLSLSGVFWDFWGTLTVAAASSDENIATALVAPDRSKLTVSAGERGRATVVVTASGGNSAASDTFTVRVKASPLVVRAIADVNDLAAGDTQAIPLSGVFQDPDGDAIDISAASSNDAVATVSMASDGSALTVAGVSGGSTTISVTAEDSDGNRVSDDFSVRVASSRLSGYLVNQSPTLAAALSDVTIANESGTRQVSLSGVFRDADKDSLSITAMSSDENKATVSVSSGHASLTVTAKARGAATITVRADDGKGGTVSDAFTVKVKAAPVVASALADVAGLKIGATQQVSLSGVFIDADGDPLSITAASSDAATATVTVAYDGSALTLAGVAEGAVTITVTAQDADGNTVSDAFDGTITAPQEQDPANQAPTVSSAIADTTIVHESGGA